MSREILEKHIKEIQLKLDDKYTNDALAQEFLRLRMGSEDLLEMETFSMAAGRLPDNRKKNRYNDIVPFDYSRVKLEEIPDFYINSSYINGPNGKVAYIAAQGPLQSTVVDFWQILWDQQIKIVVMLCNLIESGKPKCAQYWPTAVGEEAKFEDFSVSLESETHPHFGFVMRNLVVTHEGSVRRVYQFHYTEWPDHGEPAGVEPLIDLVEMIKQCQGRDVQPIVVHCSAGCGRTGTICALHYCDVMIMNGTIDEDFSVYEIVAQMRKQRVAMVQNVLQYRILHKGVLELLQRKLSEDNHVYENVTPLSQNENVPPTTPNATVKGQDSQVGGFDQYKYVDVKTRPTSDERYAKIEERTTSLPANLVVTKSAEERIRRNSDSFDKPVEFLPFAGHQIPTFPYHLDVKPVGPVEPPDIWERF